MEKIILIIITALGSLGGTYSGLALDAFEAWITKSTTLIDNALFYNAVKYVKAWEPKNPPVE